MSIKIKEDLIRCLESFKGVSPTNVPEFNKVVSTLKRPDVIIPFDRQNKQKIGYLLGLLFYQMPELARPDNEKSLNFFSSKIKLDAAIEPILPYKPTTKK